MMTAFFCVQILMLASSYALGRRAAASDESLTVENALGRFKSLVILSVVSIGITGLVLVALFFDSLSAKLPLLAQRFDSWIVWGSVSFLLATISGFTLSLAYARSHEQLRSLVLAVPVLNVAVAIGAYQFLCPVYEELGANQERDGVVLQSTGYTCVPASLVNVLRRHDIELTEREAAKMLLTAKLGTTRGPIRHALSTFGLGYETFVLGDGASLRTIPRPAILFVDHPSVGREGHAVALMGLTEKGYEIWDPLSGREDWNEALVSGRWHGSAIACPVPANKK